MKYFTTSMACLGLSMIGTVAYAQSDIDSWDGWDAVIIAPDDLDMAKLESLQAIATLTAEAGQDHVGDGGVSSLAGFIERSEGSQELPDNISVTELEEGAADSMSGGDFEFTFIDLDAGSASGVTSLMELLGDAEVSEELADNISVTELEEGAADSMSGGDFELTFIDLDAGSASDVTSLTELLGGDEVSPELADNISVTELEEGAADSMSGGDFEFTFIDLDAGSDSDLASLTELLGDAEVPQGLPENFSITEL